MAGGADGGLGVEEEGERRKAWESREARSRGRREAGKAGGEEGGRRERNLEKPGEKPIGMGGLAKIGRWVKNHRKAIKFIFWLSLY